MTDMKGSGRSRGECNAAFNIVQHDQFGGGSVMVWGGRCMEGRTDLYRLDNGTMTAIRYRDEILDPLSDPTLVQWGSCGESVQAVPGE